MDKQANYIYIRQLKKGEKGPHRVVTLIGPIAFMCAKTTNFLFSELFYDVASEVVMAKRLQRHITQRRKKFLNVIMFSVQKRHLRIRKY